MAWRYRLKAPRPTKFLHFMSLRTGTALILLTHLINKISAVYGILAIFTSYPLSALQLSMYIYSLPVLLATIYLASPVRAQSPWHCLAFAYLYALDSLVNAVYTALFGVTWFVMLTAADGKANSKLPGGTMMGETSGFMNPEHNVSQVEVVAKPKPGARPAQEAIAIGTGTGGPAASSLANAVFSSSSMMSVFIICGFWLLRMYAVFVVMAYARQVLRHHIQTASLSNLAGWSEGKGDNLADDPFAQSRPQGDGLKGKIGRLMVGIGRSYWLGHDGGSDIAMRNLGSKFRKSEDVPGVTERERRRRSGTGPPAPPPGLVPGP